MKKNTYSVVGVMSGTSLDGIDLALCNFKLNPSKVWEFNIQQAETIAYPVYWKQKLQEAIHLPSEELHGLNAEYTSYLAEVINDFIHRHHLQSIDAVCSHGHTVIHEPAKGVTLQIGNLRNLAHLIQKTVVCDFRVQDVALGGQGAPLVPIGDHLLFGAYDCCLNLGGFANVSFQKDGKRLAFDVCPVNVVLNTYSEKLGRPFDDKGLFASSGLVNFEVLDALNALDYYTMAPPKSLGIEWVKEHVFPILERSNLRPEDVLATYVRHIAIQLEKVVTPMNRILVTGGGAHNKFLIDQLKSMVSTSIEIPEKTIVEYKEALIFGFLGILKLRNEVNCLSSVTGASKDHSGGVIYVP